MSNDTLYLIATIGIFAAMALSFWASWKVKHTYRKYSNTQNSKGLTGASAARLILDRNNLRDVPVVVTSGTLTDYYDPKTNQVVLGENEYSSMSSVAIGVAAHECGHAIQYAENYLPAKVRLAIVPAANFGSKLAWPLILVGALLTGLSRYGITIIYIGIALYALCALFQIVTLPTEFDASKRALQSIEDNGILSGIEYHQAKEVLTAAALTYVAAMALTLAQLLRLIALYGGRQNRD